CAPRWRAQPPGRPQRWRADQGQPPRRHRRERSDRPRCRGGPRVRPAHAADRGRGHLARSAGPGARRRGRRHPARQHAHPDDGRGCATDRRAGDPGGLGRDHAGDGAAGGGDGRGPDLLRRADPLGPGARYQPGDRTAAGEGYAMSDREPRNVTSVGGLVVRDNAVLLVRMNYGPNRGRYMLPGGLIDPGETLDVAIAREVLEEAGVEARPVGIIGLRSRYDGPNNDTYVLWLL